MTEDKIISRTSEWSFELLRKYDEVIGRFAKDFCLDTYPNQIEVITAEQMMDAYASVGMPINYAHWSFGKHFLNVEKNYKRGRMGLAYEIVINSNPSIAYLMEENTMTMQALVIAHACYGHNSFFKNNYLFRNWTNADAIVDYLVFAKNYISECEEHYGTDAVEEILDACHALMNYGVDKYKRPPKLSIAEEQKRLNRKDEYLQTIVNDLWRTIPKSQKETDTEMIRVPDEPQENILYFIEKKAPLLEPWQREIIRIVRKMSQYFYPQKQTKLMNEGWATFWHYTLINALYDEGYVTDEFMLEFLQSHTNVILQPDYNDPRYSGINPYALGFAMMRDIQRICQDPTEEDKEWFPELVHTDWIKSLDFAMRNFKDESFVAQYLSPKIMRDFKLFGVLDDDHFEEYRVQAIHNDEGYQTLRSLLSDQYNLGVHEPNIQVYNIDVRGDRSMTLRHYQFNRRPLDENAAMQVLKHLHTLWKFDIHLECVDDHEKIGSVLHCPAKT